MRARACRHGSVDVVVSSVLTSLLAGFYNQHFSICQIQVISEGERMATVISVFFTSQSLHYRVKVPVQSLPRKTFTISLPPELIAAAGVLILHCALPHLLLTP